MPGLGSLVSRPARKSNGAKGTTGSEFTFLPECHALLENGEEDEKASADSCQRSIRVDRHVIHTKQPFEWFTDVYICAVHSSTIPSLMNSFLTCEEFGDKPN